MKTIDTQAEKTALSKELKDVLRSYNLSTKAIQLNLNSSDGKLVIPFNQVRSFQAAGLYNQFVNEIKSILKENGYSLQQLDGSQSGERNYSIFQIKVGELAQ